MKRLELSTESNQKSSYWQSRKITKRGLKILSVILLIIISTGFSITKAQTLTVKITSDNAYVFGFGDIKGITDYRSPGVANLSAAEIYGGGAEAINGAEIYTINANIEDKYIYILCWSDESQYQGTIAEFTYGSKTVVTSPTLPNPYVQWEVYATGSNLYPKSNDAVPGSPDYIPRGNSNCPALNDINGVDGVNTHIARANLGLGDPAKTSVGWVSTTTPTGYVGVLVFGNNNAQGFPYMSNPKINNIIGTAQWMWYNPDPANISEPFATGSFPKFPSAASREYYIFRVGPLGELFDKCQTFEDDSLKTKVSSVGSWVMYNSLAPNASSPTNISIEYNVERGSKIITASDASGATFLINHSDFDGNWISKGNTCFCFDLKLISDGQASPTLSVKNGIFIFQNLDLTKVISTSNPYNPGIGFEFVLNNTYDENTPWQRICLPIATVDTNDPLPSNEFGHWQPYVLGGLSDNVAWNTLIQNVTDVGFFVDATGANQSEIIGLDSICVGCETAVDTICGRKIWDKNCNGKFDAGDVGLAGWTIQLINVRDTGVFKTTVTDAEGNYCFYNLPDGSYIVKEVQQSDYTLKYPVSGQYSVTLNSDRRYFWGIFLNCKDTPQPDGCCDSLGIGPSGWTGGSLFSHKYTVYNQKKPYSDICKITIKTTPTPTWGQQGGDAQYGDPLTTFNWTQPYHVLDLSANPAKNWVSFVYGIDWNEPAPLYTDLITVYHCDGDSCVFSNEYDPVLIVKRPGITSSATINDSLFAASIKLKGTEKQIEPIRYISFNLLDKSARLFASGIGNNDTLDTLLTKVSVIPSTDLRRALFAFNPPLRLSSGELSKYTSNLVWRGGNRNSMFMIQLYNPKGDPIAYDSALISTVTDVKSVERGMSGDEFELLQGVPNPSVNSMTLHYIIGTQADVRLLIYNSLGQEIKAINEGFKPQGIHNYELNTSDFISGTYFVKLVKANRSTTLPIIINK